MEKRRIEWHGHRGCRGLRPENSLIAFEHAASLGVDALEMDVVISGDGEVIIAHEAFMPGHICETPDGRHIAREEQEEHNVFKMKTAHIQQYNCGLAHPEFPEQKSEAVHRPRLAELFMMMKDKHQNLDMRYTIELKSKPETDDIFHPTPENFVKLVLDTVDKFGLREKCLFQSFDYRLLREFRNLDATIQCAALVERSFRLDELIEELGFTPAVLGPKYTLVDEVLVKACHDRDMRIIPWTVNEIEDMQMLLDMGVDGIITDYPDRRPKTWEKGSTSA